MTAVGRSEMDGVGFVALTEINCKMWRILPILGLVRVRATLFCTFS